MTILLQMNKITFEKSEKKKSHKSEPCKNVNIKLLF